MVAPALMVASQNIAGAPQDWMELPPTSAALLVEFGAETDGELDRLVAGAEEILREHEMIRPADFTRDPERVEVVLDRARGAARPDRALPRRRGPP